MAPATPPSPLPEAHTESHSSPPQAPSKAPQCLWPEAVLLWKEKVKPVAPGRLLFWGLHQELTEVASSRGPWPRPSFWCWKQRRSEARSLSRKSFLP